MLIAVVSKNRQKLIYRFRNLNLEVDNGLSLLHLIDILYSNYHEKNDNNMQLKESVIYCIRFWVTILFNVIRLFNFQERFPLILAKFIGTSKYRILSSCNDRPTKKLSPPTFSSLWAYLYLYLTPPQSHFLSGVESVLSISIDSEIGSSCIYPISVFWSLTSLKGMTIFRRRFYDVSSWEGVTNTVCLSLPILDPSPNFDYLTGDPRNLWYSYS